MGCGTSKVVDIQNGDVRNGREPINGDHDGIVRKKSEVSITRDDVPTEADTPGDEGDKSDTEEKHSGNSPQSPETSDNEYNNSNTTISPDPCGKTPSNMILHERLRILSARRRSLEFEIGRETSDDEMDSIKLKSEAMRRGSLPPPSHDFPKRKSIFPPPPPRNDYSSPFGPRRKLSLTDSQKDFFRMLDEKVAQGKDYHSEDDKSISSHVSRGGGRKLSTILDALRSQQVR